MWWILQKRKYPSRYPSRFGVIPHDILTTHYQILHIIVETSVLGASVSSIMSGRICYCVGTYKILRRDVQDATSGRNFGNTKNAWASLFLWQYMADYGNSFTKKHKSIIIKSQTKKRRVHHELMVHPPKTTNNFTKLITYQSSSFCLPASLLHPM